MKELELRILEEGRALDGDVLKIDSFLNHQVDTLLLEHVGEEFRRLFDDPEINKILTIESSGIAIATFTARHYNYIPVVFGKKMAASNMSEETFSSHVHSFTRNRDFVVSVAKNYLNPGDKVLIIDDFLATGDALRALIDICHQAGATVAGCGIVVEKTYMGGAKVVRDAGVRLESLAKISYMDKDIIQFESE